MYRHYKADKDCATIVDSKMEFSNPDWGSVAMTTDDLQFITRGPEQDNIDVTKKELTVEDFIRRKWEREQEQLKKQLFIEDVDDWSKHRITEENEDRYPFMKRLRYIGGVDISFVKGDNINACAAFVVLNYPELEVVYEDLSMVELTAPYIPGFLAFREADFLVAKIRKLRETRPEIMPQVVLVDGNGILHPRGFGLASQLGVITDLPMIGIAKNLMYVDGLERNEEHHEKIKNLKKAGDFFPLIGNSGKTHGIAYRSCDTTTNPVFISPGHKISVDTALWVTEKCIKYRIPEPTRQADLRSHEYLRVHWDTSKHREKKQTKKPKAQKKRPPPEDIERWQELKAKKQQEIKDFNSEEENDDNDLGLGLFD